MSSSYAPVGKNPPIIGCPAYRGKVDQNQQSGFLGVPSSYVEAIKIAGGIPILIPTSLSEQDISDFFSRIDGLLLPGGGDVDPTFYNGGDWHSSLRGVDQARDRLEISLVRMSISQNKPMLAICRGHQVMNVAMGGTLWQDIESQVSGVGAHDFNSDTGYPRTHLPHLVEVESGSILSSYIGAGTSPVNSIHHQAIRDLAPGLRITANASDGLIEGIEVVDHPFAIGVQWHPENLIYDNPDMLALFSGLVKAASYRP